MVMVKMTVLRGKHFFLLLLINYSFWKLEFFTDSGVNFLDEAFCYSIYFRWANKTKRLIVMISKSILELPRWLGGKESTCQCRILGLDPWVGKIPWRRKWQPTPVFLPGKSSGQRSLVGYSPWGHKGSMGSQRVRYDWATELQQQHNAY